MNADTAYKAAGVLVLLCVFAVAVIPWIVGVLHDKAHGNGVQW